jgi:hypothetical protein
MNKWKIPSFFCSHSSLSAILTAMVTLHSCGCQNQFVLTQHKHKERDRRASREMDRTQECRGIPRHGNRASARRCACNLVSIVTAKVRGQICRVGAITTSHTFLPHPFTKIQIFSDAPNNLHVFPSQGLVIVKEIKVLLTSALVGGELLLLLR